MKNPGSDLDSITGIMPVMGGLIETIPGRPYPESSVATPRLLGVDMASLLDS
jgi:hypothetical protein